MNLSRIDLADIGSPEGLAKKIIGSAEDLVPPIPISEICLELDISDIEVHELEGFEGGLVTSTQKKSGIIVVRRGLLLTRERFTIAHELGHFLIPSHGLSLGEKTLCSSDDLGAIQPLRSKSGISKESEANRFAAAILLPEKFFLKDCREKSEPSLEHVLVLAAKYEVSKSATAYRYAGFRDEPCAVVAFKDSKIGKIYRNDDFPFITLRKGELLPKNAELTLRGLSLGGVSGLAKVDACEWLSIDRGSPQPPIIEQIHLQSNGHGLVFLHQEAADEENGYIEELEEEYWAPPGFR